MAETAILLIAEAAVAYGVPAVVAYAAAVVAIVAVQEDQRRSASHKANDEFNRSQRDRHLMVRGNLEPRRIVLGRRRTSGPMVYVGSYGNDREHLVFCVALAGHEVDAIETVMFNDEPVVLDGSGNVIGLLRTEQFSIADDEATFTLSGKAETGSVTAVAYYGSEAVPLAVSVNDLEVSVTGAHPAPDIGRVDIQYRPYPNPFKPDTHNDGFKTATGTGASQVVTLDHVPLTGSINIVQTETGTRVESRITSFSVAGANVTLTAVSGNQVKITYQWAASTSLARVRKYTGRMDQAADAGLIAALPGLWTADHRAAGVAYLVVELDYDREAMSGGEPNVSAIVRGAKCYDPRKNLVSNWGMSGAQAGVPGTLPTGWTTSTGNGLSYDVVAAGSDSLTGSPYVTIRVHGTAGIAGSVLINPTAFSVAPGASPGQQWAARAMVRRIAGDAWSAFTLQRLSVVHYDSGGVATTETSATITSGKVAGKQDPIEVEDASMASGTVKAGMRVGFNYAAGQVIDITLMVLSPQLWQGEVGDENDPLTFSENPALQVATYATHPIGGRLPWDQVDMDWLSDSANVCDTETTYTIGDHDYERPLYSGGYVALSSQQPTQVLSDLCAAMGGEWAYVDGSLKVKSGGYRAPVLTIDESWLQGDQPVEIQPALERDSLVNSMRGNYSDARQFYRSVAFNPVEPAAYIAADRAKLPQEIEYGAIDFDGQAQYVASCELRRARQGMTVNLRCNYRAFQAQTFDTVAVNLARFGFVGKVFEVRSDTFSLDGGIDLVLRETGASIWDMDAGFPQTDPEPNTRLPDPWWIPAPTGLAVASGTNHLLKQDDGTIVSRAYVTWDAIADPRVTETVGSLELQWKAMVADDWQTLKLPGTAVDAYLVGVPDSHYILVRLRAIGAVGKSQFTADVIHLVVGKTAAPADVSGLTQAIIYGAIALEWNKSDEVDYAETELRRGGTDWNSAVPLTGTTPTIVRGTKYMWAWPAYGTYTVRARHRDTSGNISTTSATVTVVVDDRIKLGSSGIDVDLGGINLVSNSSFERDSNLDGLADAWTQFSGGTHGTITQSIVAGRISGSAQRFDCTSLGSAATDRVGAARTVAIGAGAIQNLSATGWFRGSTNVTCRLRVDGYDGATLVGVLGQSSFVSDGTTWERLEITPTALDPSIDSLRFYLWMEDRTSGTAVWIELDDTQIEEDGPSAWHPYPGDIVPKIWRQAADPGAAAFDGDEWYDTDDSLKHYVRIAGAWVTVRDAGISQALADAANAQDTADGKIVTFYQTSPPTALGVGDLWFDTDDGKKCYRWSGSAWVVNQDTKIAQALDDAADAQATADGKVYTFFQSSTPTATAVGDLWFKTTDQRMYRWSGSAWVLQSTVGDGDIDTDRLDDDAATDTGYIFDATGVTHTYAP